MELILLIVIAGLMIVLLVLSLTKGNNQTQAEQLQIALRQQMQENREELNRSIRELRMEMTQTINQSMQQLQDALHKNMITNGELQRQKFDAMARQQEMLLKSTEKRLDDMRLMVEEKLQKTLNERIGQSFEIVRSQLENVQKGLGEMKSLAQDVLQETLYIAYKKWDQLKEHPNQTGFLIETARYKIQDFNKKTRKLQREIPIEGHEHIEAKDQYGKVELDIVLENNLDKEDKKRFSRYFVRGFKIPEMAKLENTSENNMSVRINRLRGKVAKVIYDGKVFDKKQKMSVRNDKKETHIIERDKDQASKPDDEIQKGTEQK